MFIPALPVLSCPLSEQLEPERRDLPRASPGTSSQTTCGFVGDPPCSSVSREYHSLRGVICSWRAFASRALRQVGPFLREQRPRGCPRTRSLQRADPLPEPRQKPCQTLPSHLRKREHWGRTEPWPGSSSPAQFLAAEHQGSDIFEVFALPFVRANSEGGHRRSEQAPPLVSRIVLRPSP